MFLKIAKAYEALTDETAKENYRLYGNPDGRQALEVGVGLPPWLANNTGQAILLVLYLAVFAVGVPFLLYVTRNSNLPEVKQQLQLMWSQMMIRDRTADTVTQDKLVPMSACVGELQWEQRFGQAFPQMAPHIRDLGKTIGKADHFKALGDPESVCIPSYDPRMHLPPNFPPEQPFGHVKHEIGRFNTLMLWEYLGRQTHVHVKAYSPRPKNLKSPQQQAELEAYLKQMDGLAGMLDANWRLIQPVVVLTSIKALKFARGLNSEGYRKQPELSQLEAETG